MSQVVERCRLAPDLDIARLVTGLWQIADMERDGQSLDLGSTAAAMGPYVTAGLTTFDMADHYGSAELISGRFKKEHGGVQLFTKWVPEPGPVSPKDVRAAIERALERLQTSRLDLLQYHAWNYADPAWLDALFCLKELKEEGLIGHLGLTNFDTPHMRVALCSGIPIVSNQVSFSLLDRRAAGEMSRLCRQNGIKLLAFGTLAGGFLTERWLGEAEPDPESLETWSQMKYLRFVQEAGGWEQLQVLLRALNEVAHRRDVSIANVATRAILEEPAVGAILIGARLGHSEHIADNLRLFAFSLDDEDRALIAEAQAGLAPIRGDCGDEYRKPPFLTASGDLSHHLEGFPAPYPVQEDEAGRLRAFSGTTWEALAGFCRAVREGDRIHVSGTTATHGQRTIGGPDPAAQTHFVIDKLEGALQSLGGRLEDVVRTRVYINDIRDWEAVARAHGQRFRHVAPANTLVQATLVGAAHLVEIEAEARLRPDSAVQ